MDNKKLEWIADTLANSEDSEREMTEYLSSVGKLPKKDVEKMVDAWFKLPAKRGMMKTTEIIEFIEKHLSSKEASMDKVTIAKELIKIAKELVSAETFKCPNCGTKVLKQTGYCVKCKEKVKEAAETFKCPNCGTKVLKQTGYCVKCKEKVKEARTNRKGGSN